MLDNCLDDFFVEHIDFSNFEFGNLELQENKKTISYYDNLFYKVTTLKDFHEKFIQRLVRKDPNGRDGWEDLNYLIRKAAQKCLCDTNELKPPINLKKIVSYIEEHLDIHISIDEEFYERNVGFLISNIKKSKGFNISAWYTDKLYKSYIIAHELGHIFGYEINKPEIKVGYRTSCVFKLNKEEMFADSFAFELLLPKYSYETYGKIKPKLKQMEKHMKKWKISPLVFRRRMINEFLLFPNSCLFEIEKENQKETIYQKIYGSSSCGLKFRKDYTRNKLKYILNENKEMVDVIKTTKKEGYAKEQFENLLFEAITYEDKKTLCHIIEN